MPRRSILGVIGLGCLLVLASTASFVLVLAIKNMPSTAQYNVAPIDGMTWIDWEQSYAEYVVPINLTVEVKYKLEAAMFHNFSTLPIEVTVTNVGKLILRDFNVQVLIEDETGHIRGTGIDSARISATGERMVRTFFLYNVPSILRGQVLKIHIVSVIQGTLVVDKKLMQVRTFASLEQSEFLRVLFFFLTYSVPPVAVFLPLYLKQRVDKKWRSLEKSSHMAVLLLLLVAFLVYWDLVCVLLSAGVVV